MKLTVWILEKICQLLADTTVPVATVEIEIKEDAYLRKCMEFRAKEKGYGSRMTPIPDGTSEEDITESMKELNAFFLIDGSWAIVINHLG